MATSNAEDEKDVDRDYLKQFSSESSYAKEQELTELREWKKEIGIPAQQNMRQLLADNARLTKQSKVQSLEIQSYREEVHKLKNDNQDLSEEIVNRQTSFQDESRSLQSLKEKEEELFELHRRCEALQADALQHKQQKEELTRKCDELQKQNEQYLVLVDKMQNAELSLKDKVHRESIKFKELQDKYSELELRYHTQQSFTKETVGVAQELRSEVSYLNKMKNNTTLESIESDEVVEFRNTKNKTIRMARPQTLRLDESRLENISEDSNGAYTLRMLQWEDSALHCPQDPDARYPHALQWEDSTLKEFGDSGVSAVNSSSDPFGGSMGRMKEELQIEFDNKLGEEKGKLIEKHQEEMTELKQQMVEYKKKLIMKNKELTSLQNEQLDAASARTYHQKNPNNQANMSKCRVFGWTMW